MSKKRICKTFISLLLCMILTLSLVGCSNKEDEKGQDSPSQEATADGETDAASGEADGTQEPVEESVIRLYFVRHGKTILNTLDRVQGWSDSPLTDAGIDAAKDTAAGLADIAFDYVYSSDRIRSIQTAEIIMENNTASGEKEIHKVRGLRETNFGKYEGELNTVMWGEALERVGAADFDELYAMERGTVKAFNAIAENDETGEAESFDESSARLMEALYGIIEEVETEGKGGNVLIAGHGAATGKIISTISGQSVGELPNASVSEIEYKGGKFEIKTIGDMSYSEKGAKLREQNEKEVVVYLTRHGKTVFNTMDRVQGWIDSPLTDAGIEVAEHLGKGVSDIEFSGVYTSDMGRTIETAEIVLKENEKSKDLTIHQRPGLRETFYGKYEGGYNSDMLQVAMDHFKVKDREELMSLDHSIEKVLDVLHDTDESGMAENFTQMSTRVFTTFQEVCEDASKNGGGNILVVSHGNAIMAVLKSLGEIKTPDIKNASVTKIIYKNGQFTIEGINDLSYVEKGAAK